MISKIMQVSLVLIFLFSCTSNRPSTKLLGKFRVESDLFLAHFDCKTDVDDLHSVAGVATMLADHRFSDVDFHAVAGAYGIQEGLYVQANELFRIAFGKNWSDAHTNFELALDEVTLLGLNTLKASGAIWIAEAGQSDFSAALIRNIKTRLPEINTIEQIHVVQHSDWNEESAAPDNLYYVKANASYHKIPDGNVIGNGSPGFISDESVNWQDYITNSRLIKIWNMAFQIANNNNGKENRHNNPFIANGGMDFSDVSETCWIFGFDQLENINQFFREFRTSSNTVLK